ncbi:MAG TPA: serine/threonine protein kinase [Cyanobacteria bacterium UBA11149]|nr:serine/threonine protein kinase [Cyanobacteria bacterium UBA11367]HBE60767.1 serine/threonine protein kinase [Cyanobacteria bacterium UBA11366]HBK66812.1 serine/threonine protein kinase [Cyanobacteria bacterium UBA11166]HBR72802.1 serine/threonine protein kinase [Cyanobacteria bacterium UBA11159]HBS72268.1 serine/threonine protein kinase [Cyanobacteria bacterium UBA11153]HBW88302.1 serine/threonine protein kinase [Cyanobacteria bacterium UBA11149]HCA95124.1 serine/threonine protein kinase 
MIGILLDQRYQIVEVLSQGGFGHTYIAQDTRRPGNPTCVVKHLKPATSDRDFLETARRLFNGEAETLEKLGFHDQIPRLLAYFEENQEFYLVEEFISGHTLSKELLPGERWHESQVIQLLQEVLSILEFVHHNGVIHRDIKPDNLIRRHEDNKLVLVDFGAVKQVQMHSIVATQAGIGETVAIGTPGYMPSEQGQGRPRPSSDIYALGIIGIQALTGLNPRQLAEDPDTGEILWRDRAQVNDMLAAILSQMVRHYFKHRYQSATEVLQALAFFSHPYQPKAFVATIGQMGRYYLTNGYNSAVNALRSLASLTKSQISPHHTASFGSTTGSGTANPSPDISGQNTVTVAPGNSAPSSEQNTVTVAPVNPANSPLPAPPYPIPVVKVPQKLPIIIGASAASMIIGAGAIALIGKISPNPKTPQTTAKIQTTNPTPSPKPENSCILVIQPSNVRSLSGRSKTGEVVKAGTKVSVTGKEDGGWIEISSPVSGWIWKSRTKNTCPPQP